MRVVRIFIMVARCSKCDFWNLWKIWDRNRYSEIFWSKHFSSKKIRKLLVEFFLGPTKFDFWSKFFSLKKSMKIQNFEISKKNRTFFEISKFWIFIDFFNEKCFDKKSKVFGPNCFSAKSWRIIFDENCFDQFFRVSIPIPKFPKILKITLKTACDHLKNMKNQKDVFSCYML